MLGCFSRLRRPASTAGAPAPVQHPCDDASTSATSTSTTPTSPCSSSSSARFKKASLRDGGSRGGEADGAVAKEYLSSAVTVDSGLSSAIASRRFFLASPGRSNSIVDSSAHAGVIGLGAAGVAVPTYSPDPHADFLKSMEEMSAALQLDARRRGDRARLHELLLCYLALNDKRAHRYIVSAFTDLLLRLTATTDDLELDDEQDAL
ncbi:transcription repressor OFP12-like [Lolium rigidum]|uniref:transcription repressor OFP12-like n=1 Tax=Lolium rigidum TaxID=89674 RepID=UPI001F5D6A62|nr:transcription repressor OFP12-like [Lolium rigidum]